MKLHEKIALLRRREGWSQEELAERMDVSRQSVSKWESGQSTPELERIVQMCGLFGLTADALIREDVAIDGPGSGEEAGRGLPVLTLEDIYDYIAQYRTFAEKISLGVAACCASPAPLLLLTGLFDWVGQALGIPVLLLMVAWGVYQFIMAGYSMRKYEYIAKGRFTHAPGVRKWVRQSCDQFRPVFVREISLGVALCIASPGPLIFLSIFLHNGSFAAGIGCALLLAIVSAGVFLFVRSGCLQSCYRSLLKKR